MRLLKLNELLKAYESKLKNSARLVKSGDMTEQDKLLYDRMVLK